MGLHMPANLEVLLALQNSMPTVLKGGKARVRMGLQDAYPCERAPKPNLAGRIDQISQKMTYRYTILAIYILYRL